MSLSQRLFAIFAGHLHQDSQAFPEIDLGHESLSVLGVPKSGFNTHAATNQKINYLECILFT